MIFATEQEFVSLLIPDDDQYPKTHTPYVLPDLPPELNLQETFRHISHLETKLNKLHLLKRQLNKETKSMVKRARIPPSDVRTQYTSTQLLHVLDVAKSITAHKILLEKLLKRKKSLVTSYKKEAPRPFLVPYRAEITAPELPPIDPAANPLSVAEKRLDGWTLPLPPR